MRAAGLFYMSTDFFLSTLAEVAPQSPEPQLLDVDGTVWAMFALFLITAFVLNQWLWKPYIRVREERVARVDGYRQEAERLEREAASRLARVEAQLAEARRAGSAERSRARNEAQAHEGRLVAEAQAAAQRALADARTRVEAAIAAERAKLHDRAAFLGREITEKVLGRSLVSSSSPTVETPPVMS
jgi:F-type H+-transporting ATPase subunit b